MKAFYDIHIHSTLSACASELQTPNNILNMCMLKQLNIISITDHNSLKHLPTFSKIISSYNFLFLYGVEITVKEGFHVLAYFETLETAMIFDSIIESKNPKNCFDFIGIQQIYDEYDQFIREIPYKLNVNLNLSFQELIEIVHSFQGVIVLAHIDRVSGILDCYEDFSNFDIDAIEIKYLDKIDELFKKHPYLKKYPWLYSSDAHDLLMIHEAKYFIEVDELSFQGFKKALRR